MSALAIIEFPAGLEDRSLESKKKCIPYYGEDQKTEVDEWCPKSCQRYEANLKIISPSWRKYSNGSPKVNLKAEVLWIKGILGHWKEYLQELQRHKRQRKALCKKKSKPL